jgi:preprotein translocase subunit SecF
LALKINKKNIMTNFQIVQKKALWLISSLVLFLVMVGAIVLWGFKYGIDFTGGSLLEVKYAENRPVIEEVNAKLATLNLGGLVVQEAGDKNIILRFQNTEEEKHQAALKALNEIGAAEEQRYESVGPVIGQELKRKSVYSIFFVLIGILIYITYSFRGVSKPVESWKYGAAAIIAMFHDAIITMGIFSVLGKFYGMEINTPFVTAILTVMGYSVHDTIVVFDRTRENLPKSNETFEGTVNRSVNQTLGRSLSTSLTSLLTLIAIIIFGGESIRPFALALAIGIFFGTYSSIFLASPLLVAWDNWKTKA